MCLIMLIKYFSRRFRAGETFFFPSSLARVCLSAARLEKRASGSASLENLIFDNETDVT